MQPYPQKCGRYGHPGVKSPQDAASPLIPFLTVAVVVPFLSVMVMVAPVSVSVTVAVDVLLSVEVVTVTHGDALYVVACCRGEWHKVDSLAGSRRVELLRQYGILRK